MAHVWLLSLIQICATPGPSFFVACWQWENGLCGPELGQKNMRAIKRIKLTEMKEKYLFFRALAKHFH